MTLNKEQVQKAFVTWFTKKAQAAGKDPLKLAKELGDEGMKQAYEQFVTEMLSQGTKARLGAKLQYILRLTAPKFACGGKTKKKACSGKKLEKGNAILEFKKRRKQF